MNTKFKEADIVIVQDLYLEQTSLRNGVKMIIEDFDECVNAEVVWQDDLGIPYSAKIPTDYLVATTYP